MTYAGHFSISPLTLILLETAAGDYHFHIQQLALNGDKWAKLGKGPSPICRDRLQLIKGAQRPSN